VLVCGKVITLIELSGARSRAAPACDVPCHGRRKASLSVEIAEALGVDERIRCSARLTDTKPSAERTPNLIARGIAPKGVTVVNESLPRSNTRALEFENGSAIGISNRWEDGQYCSILTSVGIVGCGIYNIQVATEFNMAVAIAKGTPSHPLREPEDLYEAKIIDASPRAKALGIEIGMPGREAVELMLASQSDSEQ
jgi:uncharacterized protein YunC (DUF1805 family)